MSGPESKHNVHHADDPPNHSPPIGDLRNALRRLRASAKVQLVVQRLGMIVAVWLAMGILVGLMDYWLRLPMIIRLILWVGLVGSALWSAFRRLAPVASFSPSLTEFALRIEQSPAGRKAGLEGTLASAIELARAPRHPSGELAGVLTRGVITEATQRFGLLPRWTSFLHARELRRTLVALLAVGTPVLILSILAPMHARIGWARVGTPWTNASWPKRTAVTAGTQPIAHAINAPLPLRAILTRIPAGEMPDVIADYRLVVDGASGPWRSVLLTSQQRTVTVDQPGGAPPASGTLYERLLDTASLVGTARGSTLFLEFAFRTDDDETAPWRVVLVDPPTLLGASAVISPPDYARSLLEASSPFALGSRDLGPGRDERAALGPILAGSHVTLTLTLNKPVPTPDPSALQTWVASTLPGLEHESTLSVSFNGRVWTIGFNPAGTVRLPVILTDSFGIRSTDEATFRFEVVTDRPASAAIIDPPADEAVLATAIIPLAAEGRDDVALAWAAMTVQPARVPANSAGAAPEPTTDPTEIARASAADAPPAPTITLRAHAELDLAPLELDPGDEVRLQARALDVLAAWKHDAASESDIRRLRIIAESEFVEQVRAELSGVREAAKRLASDQDRLATRRDAAVTDPDAAAAQAQGQQALGQRLTPMGDVLRRLSKRVERNNLSDRTISGLLVDAAAHVDAAGEQSDAARRALEALAAEQASPEAKSAAAADAARAQTEVEAELSALANLLDRGQDSWAVRREIEKLLTEQRLLRAQTQAAGEDTRGTPMEHLAPARREDLERLARRQQDAARRADTLVDTLHQRANDLRAGDAAQADAMRAAAARAQREQVGDTQRRAGEQIQMNQTAQANDLQTQAEQALVNMLAELDKAQSRQEETLRRLLADLVESIRVLIAAQQRELARLGEAAQGQVPAQLDGGMIALHQNTLGVRDKAEAGARGVAKLLGLLGAAANAQASGIASIRAQDFPAADGHERLSLAKLNEALEEARKLEEQSADREAREKRAELRKAYQEALEAQAGLLASTRPLVGQELTRRQKSEARALGDQQLVLREQLSQMRSQTQDIADAVLFSYAHDRLDAAMASAAGPLRDGMAPPMVGFHQTSALRTLQALLAALAEEPRDSEFREEEGSEGGGGGGGAGGGGPPPLVPPIAELKLLRALQAEAAELTRALGDAGDAALEAHLLAAGSLQRDLANRARTLLEKLNERLPPDDGVPVRLDPAPPPDDGGAP